MIEAHDITKSYGDQLVLKELNLTIQPGERVSLTGPGGCGKTTLLKILLGLVVPDSGTATLAGVDMHRADLPEREACLKRVGMAFQQGGLFDSMSVDENLVFAMQQMTDLSKEEMQERIDALLATVKLSRAKNQFPHELSGGMRRRVGLVRALLNEPDIAFFDEPTAGLDPVTSTIILNMIGDLGAKNSRAALLVSTSNVEMAMRFAERLVVLREGRIVADDSWKALLLSQDSWVVNFLSVRLLGLDRSYVEQLGLPKAFLDKHWQASLHG